MLGPGQTIATVQRQTWQHCWPNDHNIQTQHMATLLPYVTIALSRLRAFDHPVATCCNMLGVRNRASAHALVQQCCAYLTKRVQHHATLTNVA